MSTKAEMVERYREGPNVAGARDDWEIIKGRKEYRCDHTWSDSLPIKAPCKHPIIAPNEWHVLTRQSWLERGRCSIPCALAEGRIHDTYEKDPT